MDGCTLKKSMILSLTMILWGCGGSGSGVSWEESTPITEEGTQPRMALNVNTYPVNNLVCNPFQSEEENMFSFSRGLKGELFHLENAGPVGDSVKDYILRAHRSRIILFFKSLYIRTQKFLTGFNYTSGGLVHNHRDEIVHNHFALRLTGQLILSKEQSSGDYEFSMLNDDGAVFRIFHQGEWVEMIDNDGTHPTHFACGIKSLYLEKGKAYPIEILYFQASRNSPVAIVPLWRRVRTGPRMDPFCGLGKGSGQRYFDEDNHSLPFPAYVALGVRGWRPIHGENLMLPPSEEFNPCADSKQVPVIENFQFSIEKETVSVSWTTDIPSTSQVVYTRSDTGEQVLTESDNILRTDHLMTIPRNPVGVSYIVRAISISETFGKTVSGGYSLHRYF